ncbi:MAG: PP2C family protein-serine/threonine phosphatase [Acidobacteria bacterium]|nr:PP2C family protein-serine/threonine phosphatase [Acidobacteriota bacterium]
MALFRRGPAALPSPVGGSQRRVRTALLKTLPGRAIVIGAAIKLVDLVVVSAAGGLPAFLAVVDTVAGIAIALGAGAFLLRLFVLAKRRLLWRVRRKLILSYVFIGFVPAILIVGFFLLCGFLLFYNFSSFLIQSRVRALGDQARFLAQSAAVEIERAGAGSAAAIVERRQEMASREIPGVSMAVVPAARRCAAAAGGPAAAAAGTTASVARAAAEAPITAGAWDHVAPPSGVPAWIGCDGFAGVLAYAHRSAAPAGASAGDTHMLVRAVAFPDVPDPAYAVVVDVLLTDALRRHLQDDTGVELRSVSAVPNARGVAPMPGLAAGPEAPAGAPGGGLLNNLVSLMEYRDWTTGETGTLLMSARLSVTELYDRISSSEGMAGRSFGQGLLLALFLIGALFLVIEVIALIVGFALARSITGSVHELFAGTERVRLGDFTHKIAVRSEDQLGELAGSFNQMTASIEDLLQQAAEKKRLEEELRIAREIQMSLLPQGPLDMKGLSLTALCVPAREVGGDYYDFFRLSGNRLGVLIADVSGKGTSAAFYMAELKGLVLSLSQIHPSPRDLLIAANRIIADNLDARSFITMTYAVIDLDAGRMTYARAGHTPMMYLPGACADEPRQVRVLAPDGLVLGLKIDGGELFERLLTEESVMMQPGDVYVLFTDGITEAMNDRDDCFGEARLADIVARHADLPPDRLREHVLRSIEAFVGGAPQHDDMTMIVLKVSESWTLAPSAAVVAGVAGE